MANYEKINFIRVQNQNFTWGIAQQSSYPEEHILCNTYTISMANFIVHNLKTYYNIKAHAKEYDGLYGIQIKFNNEADEAEFLFKYNDGFSDRLVHFGFL